MDRKKRGANYKREEGGRERIKEGGRMNAKGVEMEAEVTTITKA